jgi:hypothetical protein
MSKHLHEELAELNRKSLRTCERVFYRMARACKHYAPRTLYECLYKGNLNVAQTHYLYPVHGKLDPRPCAYEICPLLYVEEGKPGKKKC